MPKPRNLAFLGGCPRRSRRLRQRWGFCHCCSGLGSDEDSRRFDVRLVRWEGGGLTRVKRVLFSNLVRSRFWVVVFVTTYLLSVSRSAARKPLYVVFGESTRTWPQSNGAAACRGTIDPAWMAGARSSSDSSILVDFGSPDNFNRTVSRGRGAGV